MSKKDVSAGGGNKQKDDGALLIRIITLNLSNTNKNGRAEFFFKGILETYFMQLAWPQKEEEKEYTLIGLNKESSL